MFLQPIDFLLSNFKFCDMFDCIKSPGIVSHVKHAINVFELSFFADLIN